MKNDTKDQENYVKGLISYDDITKVENPLLNRDQLQVLFLRTPQEYIKERKAKGKGNWTYVSGAYMKKQLNRIFGWDWDYKVLNSEIHMEAKQCIVHGELTCRVGGRQIVKHQFGRADIKFKNATDPQGNKVKTDEPLDLGNDMKAAATDALKKCASEIGVASDIYAADEFKVIKFADDKPDLSDAFEEHDEDNPDLDKPLSQ